jgi:flagellar motor switch protein FliM
MAMDDLFTTKGTLAVSIGEGFLSSFEASTLKRGDIVRTTRLPGMPSMLHFNGVPICPCEIAVLGGVFAVRITQRPFRDQAPEPGLGTRDDLVEILPSMVRLGSIHISLAELKAARPGTFIGLGKKYSAGVDAELVVAGIPVAVGKVIAFVGMGGCMGIQIDRVNGTSFKESNIRSSGYLHEPGSLSEKWVPYDFTRPDWFTVNCIARMDALHALFFRNLKAGLPQLAQMLSDHSDHPALVDQLLFAELKDSPPQDVKLRPFGAEIVSVRGSREAREPASPAPTAFLEEEGTQHPVDSRIRAELEKLLLGMETLKERNPIVFFYRDEAGMRGIFEGTQARETLLACLRGAWKNLVDLKIRPSETGEAGSFSSTVHRQEMILVVAFNGKDGKAGLLIVYPYRTLEPYMGLLE